jgi:hypothetical protein
MPALRSYTHLQAVQAKAQTKTCRIASTIIR